MKVRDKELKETVDVLEKACLSRKCYWPRPNPGSFSLGVGYKSTSDRSYLCGTRHARGCPSEAINSEPRSLERASPSHPVDTCCKKPLYQAHEAL